MDFPLSIMVVVKTYVYWLGRLNPSLGTGTSKAGNVSGVMLPLILTTTVTLQYAKKTMDTSPKACMAPKPATETSSVSSPAFLGPFPVSRLGVSSRPLAQSAPASRLFGNSRSRRWDRPMPKMTFKLCQPYHPRL